MAAMFFHLCGAGMQAGGMVTKAAHLEEVSHLQTEVDLLKQQLAVGQGEALQVRARREQLLGAADAAAEAALVLEADGGADQPHGERPNPCWGVDRLQCLVVMV